MPLFQPTNIIPSSFSGVGNGTIDANDNVSISWQVNGTVLMTAFKIVIQTLAAEPTTVKTITVTSTPNGSSALPFAPKDNRGNAQFYEYNPSGVTWSSWGITNGSSYTLSIEQTGSDGVVVSQYSASAFIARSKPTVVFNPPPTVVDSPSATFEAIYSQAQGDPMNWCRWTLYQEQSDGSLILLEDTGELFTTVLTYSYKGFMRNTNYAISLIVESANGVQATTGTVTFSVAYDAATDSNPLSVIYMPDSSVQIDVGGSGIILGSPTPQENYGSVSNGALTLDRESSVLFSTGSMGQNTMQIQSPFSLEWRGGTSNLRPAYTSPSSFGEVYAMDIIYDSNNIPIYLITVQGNPVFVRLYSISISSEGETTYQLSHSFDASAYLTPNDLQPSVSVNKSGTLFVITQSDGVYYGEISAAQITSLSALNAQRYTDGIYYGKFVGDTSLIIGTTTVGTDIYTVNGTQIASYTSLQDTDSENVNSTCVAATYYSNGSYVFLGTSGGKGLFCAFKISDNNEVSVFSYFETEDGGGSGHYICSNIAYGYSMGSAMLIAGGVMIGSTGTPMLLGYLKTYSVVPSSSGFIVTEQMNVLTDSSISNDWIAPIQNPFSWSFGYLLSNLFSSGEAMFSVDFSSYTITPMYHFEKSESANAYIGVPTLFFSYDTASSGFVMGGSSLRCYDSFNGFQSIFQAAAINGVTRAVLRIALSTTQIKIEKGIGAALTLPIRGSEAKVLITPSSASVVWFDRQKFVSTVINSFNGFASPYVLSSLELLGFSTCAWIGVQLGAAQYPSTSYSFDNSSVEYIFYTSFDSGKLTGIYPTEGYLYRRTGGILKLVDYISYETDQIKDFSLRSGEESSYVLISENSGEYTETYESATVCLQFNGYYLLETQRDSTSMNVFRVLNTWKFGNNIESGSISNNNTPTWLTNFTPYRLKQMTSRTGKSGTLKALLGNTKNQKYSDTVALMESLFRISTSDNTLFLKDMKGNLYMVSISAPITQTIETKSKIQQVTVSVPWEEIGSTDGISIIQTPTDKGWGNSDSNF